MNLRRTFYCLAVLTHYLLLVCLAGIGNVLLGSAFKLFAYTAFALLLFFVVGRSTNFFKTAAICLRILPSVFFSSGITPQWICCSQAALILPDDPLRATLFQRPPPQYSL